MLFMIKKPTTQQPSAVQTQDTDKPALNVELRKN